MQLTGRGNNSVRRAGRTFWDALQRLVHTFLEGCHSWWLLHAKLGSLFGDKGCHHMLLGTGPLLGGSAPTLATGFGSGCCAAGGGRRLCMSNSLPLGS